MLQRALKAGVLANPYRYIEPGQEFDHHVAMNWAEPVELDEQPPDEGQQPETRPAGRRKRTTAEQPAGGEADPI